jgi:hypothetical protein
LNRDEKSLTGTNAPVRLADSWHQNARKDKTRIQKYLHGLFILPFFGRSATDK